MSTGYERLKRWRERHRGLANLRQRDYRKGKVRAPVKVETVLPPRSKIEELRTLMAAESAKPAAIVETVIVPPPAVYRDDYGRVITEAQWNQLQEDAARGGYVIDEFSQ